MKIVRKNITTVSEGLIVHGVNCLGIMNCGVGREIRNKWPDVYTSYKRMPTGKKMMGQTHIIRVSENLYVANCYIQLNFGDKNIKYVDLNALKECLTACFNFAQLHELNIVSSLIGCGAGGMDWNKDVKPIFKELNMEYEDINVRFYNIGE